jgi:hypothetical protein
MKTNLTLTMAAGIGIGGIALAAQSASAMPMSGLDPAVPAPSDTAKNVESVRWVCGPYRCHPGWRRGWGPGYGYWGPGWRRGWWGPSYGYWRPGLGYGYGYGWYSGGPDGEGYY